MLGEGGVLPVPARPYMDGDALAFVEDLDAPGRHPRLDLSAGEAVGDGIIVGVDLDVIVDADSGQAPFAVFVSAVGQGLERRPVDLFEQLAAGDAEPTQGLALVELGHEFAERGVDVGEAGEDPAPEPAQQPTLDDQHRLLNLGFVARLSRPRRENGGSVMSRHLGIGSVDLRIVEAGLDDGGLRIVGHEKFGGAADRLEGADMGVDPVGQRLRPGRPGECEAEAPSTATKICAMRISPVRPGFHVAIVLEIMDARHVDAHVPAGCGVSRMFRQMQSEPRSRNLHIKWEVFSVAVFPVDGEAEKSEIEFPRLCNVKDANDRNRLLEGNPFAGLSRLVFVDLRRHDVPVYQPELAGNDLKRLAVGNCYVALGKCFTHGLRHGLMNCDSRACPFPSSRRSLRQRPHYNAITRRLNGQEGLSGRQSPCPQGARAAGCLRP